MNVGLLGGTFDPIHLGHLLIAEEARACLGLDEVLFIPTGLPWMKADVPLSPSHHRLSMVRLAVVSNPFFRASSLEIDRPGPTYTVDTLTDLHREADGADAFYLILGADSLAGFHRWKDPARVLELCTMAVAPRPGHRDVDLSFLESICSSGSKKAVVIKGTQVNVSGTEVRRRVALGKSVRYQVPEEVERYIYHFGLYRDAGLAR